MTVRSSSGPRGDRWGYRSYEDAAALTNAYVELVQRLRWLQADGLAAAVYTQLTDVEIEVNGMLTYDRAQVKTDSERVRAVNAALYRPLPRVEDVVPTSRGTPQIWRYTTSAPAGEWQATSYDDGSWRTAPGGFGTTATPGATVRTDWDGPAIWLRRGFELPADTDRSALRLRLHHDEDAEVYINGVLAARLSGYTTGYVLAPIAREALEALQGSKNVLAVHCQQTGGGQFIDVGLSALHER
jgi:hypothetical protein